MARHTVMTVDGAGVLKKTANRFGKTSYFVVGNGFSGEYSRHQILSELDDDETTTDLNFDGDTEFGSEGTDGTSTTQPDEGEDDPMNLEDGTELPWDPEAGNEWDGELTQLPDDGEEADLTPSSSTKGGDFSEDPESSTQVFGKIAGINWDSADHGTIGDHHEIFVDHSPHDIHWVIGDHNGNPIHENSHSAGGQPLTDQDHDHALALMGEDADEVEQGALAHGRQGFVKPRQSFVEYIALVHKDSMVREAAWKDVRKKARRLYDNGDVMVTANTSREIVAKVDGDTGRYDTSVHRKNAFGQGVTYWDCDCEWGKHAYKRARTFIGRMCSHALATYWAMQAKQAPATPKRRIDNKTERHTLGNTPGQVGLGPKQFENVYETHNPNLDPNFKAGYEGEDPKKVSGPKFVRHPFKESLASKQGGLMIWDDDLHKVMKQMFPATAPGGGQGMPGDPGAPGASPMSADPSQAAPGVPGGLGQDPGLDPSQMGDPNGSGLQPSGATPPFVRSTNGPTQAGPVNTPTGAPVTANFYGSYMAGKLAEYETNPNPNNNFEPWGEPNSEDADTFNTVQDQKDENDPEKNVYDDFYGRSSAVNAYMAGLTPDQFTGGDQFPAQQQPSTQDPQPGADINTPSTPESSLPFVPRAQPQGGFQGYSRVAKEEDAANFAPGHHDKDNDSHYDEEIQDDDHKTAGIDGEDDNPADHGYDSGQQYPKPDRNYVRHQMNDDPWQQQEEKDPGGIATNFPKRTTRMHQFADAVAPLTNPDLDPTMGGPQDPNSMGVPNAAMPPAVAPPRANDQGMGTTADLRPQWLKSASDDDDDDSWQRNPHPADHDDDDDYDEGDEDYHNDEEDHDGKTSSRHDDEDDAYVSHNLENIRQAERFNNEADDIVMQFQRTGGRHFTFSEQQDLINESEGKTARQLADLNLANSFYE